MNPERLNDEPAHSPYGPSRAEGYFNCLDYVRANDGLPDDSTEQAAEGTFAHMISDECLSLGGDAIDYVGQRLRVEGFEFVWTEEDAQLLQPGIDWTRARGGQFFGERRVDVSPWTIEGQFGTLDRAIQTLIDGEQWAIIGDLKWGRGVPVTPIRNKQLVLYALGWWHDFKHLYSEPPRFLLWIDQPRCSGGGGFWETTLAEMEEIGAEIRQRIALSQSLGASAPRGPSEAGCIWCKRKNAPSGCAEYDAWRLWQLRIDFDRDVPLLSTSLTAEQRAYLMLHKQGIVKWLERLETAALEDTLDGKPGGGLKAVVDTRKGSRDKWIDEEKVIETLNPLVGEQLFTKKVKTPKQVAKILSEDDQDKLRGLYEPGDHGFSLVPEADARSAVVRIGAAEFDDLN